VNEITVLCWTCSTHILSTDVGRLDWPLRGEMFSQVQPNFVLRPGTLNLDIFCPVCGQFPFHYDPGVPGAIGKGLRILGGDGKSLHTTIKEILLNATGQPEADQGPSSPLGEEPAASGAGDGDTPAPEWPCPECGAKKRFHRKGCSIPGGRGPSQESQGSQGSQGDQMNQENTKPDAVDTQPVTPDQNPARLMVCPGCERQVASQLDERHLPQCPVRKGFMPMIPDAGLKGHADGFFGFATRGPDTADAPITLDDVSALEQDRQRARAGNAPRAELKRTVKEARSKNVTPKSKYLRPDELFVPKG
jgi:hypothetical protein